MYWWVISPLRFSWVTGTLFYCTDKFFPPLYFLVVFLSRTIIISPCSFTLFSPLSGIHDTSVPRVLRLYSKKNIVSGALCRSWLNFTLSHSQLRSHLSTSTTKGKGWSGKDLSYWLSTFVSVLLLSKTTHWKREITEKGEGRGESWPYMSLNIHFMEHWLPHGWVDFYPSLSWL